MKGIILAGGTGSRLWPITKSISKQLLPVYDTPMLYYPLSTLMFAGIREILIITTESDQASFIKLLGDGSEFGIELRYKVQEKPKGLAEALIIGEDFLAGDPCVLILGDNIFYGVGLGNELQNAIPNSGAHIFTYVVSNPSQYGILTTNDQGIPVGIAEKPAESISNHAVTGLYFFDGKAPNIAKSVTASERGELEITSVIDYYLQRGELTVTHLSRGTAWLDTGTFTSLHDAGTFIRILEERQGMRIGDPHEIASKNSWID